MPPGLDDDGSCAGRLQRGVLYEEVLTWPGTTPVLARRFAATLREKLNLPPVDEAATLAMGSDGANLGKPNT